MNTTQNWIPLTGPGGRLPVAEDGDMEGCLYALAKQKTHRVHWENHSYYTGTTHFCPIPKAPPLPKPVEKTQDEKDREKALEIFKTPGTNIIPDIVDGIRYGRAEGRKALAKEALGLFDARSCSILAAVLRLNADDLPRTAASFRELNALLEKAAGENV